MGYMPQNAKEVTALPPDSILDGVIININDGVVKDFVKNTEKWMGDINQSAINVTIELKHNERSFSFEQLFTYKDNNGTTEFAPTSNLGKYKKKHGKLPEVGDKVKAITDNDGFAKLKIE